MNKAITLAAIEDAKVMAMLVTDAGATPRSEALNIGPILGRPFLKQPSIDCSATDKYAKLRNSSFKQCLQGTNN